jgi:hypothetical protein
MSYAMSWDRDYNSYKYESIQNDYTVDFEETEFKRDLSLDELLEQELELEEELELEGEVF